MAVQLQQLRNADRTAERKRGLRRKSLFGVGLLRIIDHNPEARRWIMEKIAPHITRPTDRELLGLPSGTPMASEDDFLSEEEFRRVLSLGQYRGGIKELNPFHFSE